jgi:hypothetical protein
MKNPNNKSNARMNATLIFKFGGAGSTFEIEQQT